MKKIMIVEDDSTLREALSTMLMESGYKVSSASNGMEALTEIDSFNPDLVLTDISMPDMEGIELLKVLKRKNKSLPIMVMSGNVVGVNFLRSASLFGAVATLKKPFSLSELLLAIDSAFEE